MLIEVVNTNDCSTSSSNPMMEGSCTDSEEKPEPAGDIDSSGGRSEGA